MRHVRILHIEDSPADADLVRESLVTDADDVTIAVARNGTEAVAMLWKRGAHAAEPRPDLILLDVNLPQKSGWEVLAEIKADPSLQSLPVVVLTTSDAQRDVCQSYALGACAFLTKPMDLRSFRRVVGSLRSFWVETATFPASG